MNPNMLRRWAGAMALVAGAAFGSAALAHDYRAGDVRIGHPYATPTLAGASHGAAYIATLENTGAAPDRLLRISAPAAGHAEIHTMSVDSAGVMRMRQIDDLPLAPKAPIKMRPGQGVHFMLMNLKKPLKEGDTFPMTLEFERGGKVEVKVVVQVPKPRAGESTEHKH